MALRKPLQKVEVRRQRIVDAAIDEFAGQGFRQASVNRMVQKLGIAKGAIFQYFGTKEGLFKVIFDHSVDLVRVYLRKVKQETASSDFFERMGKSALAGIQFIDRHPRIYQIYLKMIFQEQFPLRAEFLQKVHLFSAEYLTPMVRQGIECGDLRPDLNVEMTVFFLDALLDRFLQAYCVSFLDAGAGIYMAGEAEVKSRVDELIRLLRHGIGSEDSRACRENTN